MKKLIILFFCIALIGFTSKAQYLKFHDFATGADGNKPYGDLVSDGTFLYGMTREGGASGFFGSIFKIKPDGTGYLKLFDFDNTTSGRRPNGSLIYDGTYLYGMTERGGTNNDGVLFKILPDGTGFTKLLDFSSLSTGNYPMGSLVSDGTFMYGLTSYGGTNGYGTLFKIMPDGSSFTKLLDFSYVPNGANPFGTLIYDGTHLYATTAGGGTGSGVVFKVKTDGTDFVKVHEFLGTTSNGGSPTGTLVSDGTYLYGMISIGGLGSGAIFKVKIDGTTYSQIYDFYNTINGISSSLIYESPYLYGMTTTDSTGFYGAVFKVMADGTGFTKLHKFTGTSVGADGRAPYGALISDGTAVYGMTSDGGINGKGTIFKFQFLPTEINEQVAIQEFAIYPNPSTGEFQLSFSNPLNESIQMKVINVLGKEVYSETLLSGISNHNLDLSHLSNGIYMLHNNNAPAQKIIIQK